MFRTIATALVCMLFATVLWADCAPDYRSDKRAGVFIADFIINETSSLTKHPVSIQASWRQLEVS
jgi:hypothetical protein